MAIYNKALKILENNGILVKESFETKDYYKVNVGSHLYSVIYFHDKNIWSCDCYFFSTYGIAQKKICSHIKSCELYESERKIISNQFQSTKVL